MLAHAMNSVFQHGYDQENPQMTGHTFSCWEKLSVFDAMLVHLIH